MRVCLRAPGKDVLAAATVTSSRLNYTGVAQIVCDKVQTEWLAGGTRAKGGSAVLPGEGRQKVQKQFKTLKSF